MSIINALPHVNHQSIRISKTLVSEPYINLGPSDFRKASVKHYADSYSTVRLSVPYRSVRNRIGYRIVHFYTFLTRFFGTYCQSFCLRVRDFRTITDTCGKILYRNQPAWTARPYGTVYSTRISESASTALYRTVTTRCTVSDTSTSTVVVSDLPNITDLPKVAGCGTGYATATHE